MSCNVTLDKRPKKFLEKLAKSATKEYLKIVTFWKTIKEAQECYKQQTTRTKGINYEQHKD